MIRRAVCPGSFDPVTHGHLDIIERTARLASEVIVAVGGNMAKNALFTPAERVEMLEVACASWDNVTVMPFSGLLVEFCTAHDVDVISKGVRAGDFAYELQMAQMNRRLTGVETILLPADPAVGVRLLLVGSRGGHPRRRRLRLPATRRRQADGSEGQCPAAERVAASGRADTASRRSHQTTIALH